MEWSTTPFGCFCGLCGRRIDKGARIALFTAHKKIRCESCVERVTVNGAPAEDLMLDDDAEDLPLPVAAEEHTACPYCQRIMSAREHREQGACNDCTSGTVRIKVDFDGR